MLKTRQVIIEEFGKPENMKIVTVDLPLPAKNEVQIKQTAIGFNFIDTYQRKGIYPLPLPTGLGHEGVGIVQALGSEVDDFKIGDRVAYINAGVGAYADFRNVNASKLVKVPSTVSDKDVASMFFKSMTAQYLLKKTYVVQKGDIILVQAAAGGVGQILCRWAKALGAFVIGTAGSEEKCAAVKLTGADVAINYSKEGWTKEFLDVTNGKKANVVYDSVGKATFMHSLDCACEFGMVVLFGAASGPVPDINPEILNKKGCLYLTRPSIFPHNANEKVFRENAADVFDALSKGYIKATIGQEFSLDDIVLVHKQAEERKTQSATIIIP